MEDIALYKDKVILQCSECGERRKTLQELMVHICVDHLQEFAYHCAACGIPCLSVDKIGQHYAASHPDILFPEFKRRIDLEVALQNILLDSFICGGFGVEVEENNDEVVYVNEGDSYGSETSGSVEFHYNQDENDIEDPKNVTMVVYNNVPEVIEEYHEFDLLNEESPPILSIEENLHQSISEYHPFSDPGMLTAYCEDSNHDLSHYVNEPIEYENQTRSDYPLQCKYCGKGFKHFSKLNEHEVIHTGFKNYSCTHCDAKFSTAASTKVHERSHTGELSYICKWQCGKRFKSSSALKMHERCHSGERNHICDICSNAFQRKSHLSRHLKTVHKIIIIREGLGENLNKVINEVVDSLHVDIIMQRKANEAFMFNEKNCMKILV